MAASVEMPTMNEIPAIVKRASGFDTSRLLPEAANSFSQTSSVRKGGRR